MGRRLSSIHLLPREADELVGAAIDAAIVRRHQPQIGALKTLNEGLAAMGIEPVAKSSWARFLARIAEEGIPPRWRRHCDDGAAGENVTIPRARYIELIEAEATLLKQKPGCSDRSCRDADRDRQPPRNQPLREVKP